MLEGIQSVPCASCGGAQGGRGLKNTIFRSSSQVIVMTCRRTGTEPNGPPVARTGCDNGSAMCKPSSPGATWVSGWSSLSFARLEWRQSGAELGVAAKSPHRRPVIFLLFPFSIYQHPADCHPCRTAAWTTVPDHPRAARNRYWSSFPQPFSAR